MKNKNKNLEIIITCDLGNSGVRKLYSFVLTPKSPPGYLYWITLNIWGKNTL